MFRKTETNPQVKQIKYYIMTHSIITGLQSIGIVLAYFLWIAVILRLFYRPIWQKIKDRKYPKLWYALSAVMLFFLLLFSVLHKDYEATGDYYNETMYDIAMNIGLVLPMVLSLIIVLKKRIIALKKPKK